MSFHPDREDSFYFCLWVNRLVSPQTSGQHTFSTAGQKINTLGCAGHTVGCDSRLPLQHGSSHRKHVTYIYFISFIKISIKLNGFTPQAIVCHPCPPPKASGFQKPFKLLYYHGNQVTMLFVSESFNTEKQSFFLGCSTLC